MAQCKEICRCLMLRWRIFAITAIPAIFSPLLLTGTKEGRCGYVVCIMAFYWITEALPLPITSLLPVLLFPMLGVLSTGKICLAYMKETNMMFIGGLIVAIAVEHCNLHQRIALRVLLLVGSSPKRLLLGFMITTTFLSMWISNTACAAMMVPIVSAVLQELKANREAQQAQQANETGLGVVESPHDGGKFDGETRRKSSIKGDPSAVRRPSQEEIAYYLGVAYASNIGGTGTLTGTGTNLTFKGIFNSIFPYLDGVNFASWMAFNVPLMLVNCIAAWIWLTTLFMGLLRFRRDKISPEQVKAVKDVIRTKYNDLGKISYHEINVLVLFITVVLLWFFRKPEFIRGWAQIYDDVKIDDSTAAMIVVVLLFILPSDPGFFNLSSKKESPTLLNWKVIHEKLPWGLILLLGGGFAMAEACKESGLSKYLGKQLVTLEVLQMELILFVISTATLFMTEVSSNTAIANIILPVLADMSVALGKHPLYLMIPATLCCSYAFMLPVATPPNAIVMAASNMRTLDMMKAGLGMNLICLGFLLLFYLTFGVKFYGLDHFPEEITRHLKGINATTS